MKPYFVLPALALLAACSSILPKSEPVDVYRLPLTARAASDAARVAWQLRIGTPDAPGALAGRRIVVAPEGDRLSVYAGARWTDDTPVLLRDRLIRAFRDDGRVGMVSSDTDQLVADYELGSRLTAFEVEYVQGRPRVRLQLQAWLTRAGHPEPIANRGFAIDEAVEGSAVPEVVAAFGRAATRLGDEVVAWTIEKAATTPAK